MMITRSKHKTWPERRLACGGRVLKQMADVRSELETGVLGALEGCVGKHDGESVRGR